jgi:hypothetical protein
MKKTKKTEAKKMVEEIKKVKSKALHLIRKEIEDRVKIIANERDKIRELYDNLASILESTDEGVRLIEEGLDELSQYL